MPVTRVFSVITVFPMEWILDHFQIILGIAAFVAWLLIGKKGRPQQRSGGQRRTDDAGEAERTRQIQEEIRRRILARQRGEAPPVAQPPPVVVFDAEPAQQPWEKEWQGEGPPPKPKPPPLPVPLTRAYDATEALREQERLLDESRQMLRSAQARVAGSVPSIGDIVDLGPKPVGASAKAARARRRELRRDLASPTSLRRVMLLKEILGEPLGLQQGLPRIPRR
jgi:hypothetical protein